MKRSHLEATASDTEVNADDQDDDAGPSRPDSTHEPTAHEEDPRKRIKLDRAKAKKQRQKENRKAAAAAALAGAAVTCAANPPIQVAATKINPTESDARATLDATSQNKTDGTALTGESSSSRVERRLGSSVSVPLDEICFTQKDMSPRFNDTRTVPDLMQSFIDGLGVIPGRGGNATPVIGTAAARGGRSPFSVMPRIRAFTHPGVVQERWFSLDNRRLRAAVDASHVILFQYIEGELNKRALSPAQLLAAHVAESPSNAAAFELQMPGSSPLPLPRLPPISVEYCDVQRDVEAKKEFHKKNSNTAWSVGGAPLGCFNSASSFTKKSTNREEILQLGSANLFLRRASLYIS
ncbi:hypothetical protein CAOG_01407 [Capsaspora owczarzaki ATCC 30864]|uniref:hypothetical protein n=1 Tax=Capsaspora owczarzaki (strain ATCC 30864) TaxID=595528 RepID=UPI0001FE3698|nr:hypothetical protein CAOG_01407 [Capsaspora owczarzaki ATCC 30864]|eukprot:XP_004349927.1 hypothetical protein CAOG_01407 [Capsaspora owczarzaki ATCC 30864]